MSEQEGITRKVRDARAVGSKGQRVDIDRCVGRGKESTSG